MQKYFCYSKKNIALEKIKLKIYETDKNCLFDNDLKVIK